MSKTDGENTSSEVRRLDPRGQFKDTKVEEINLWEDVDEKEDVVGVEEFDIIGKEETIDIKENLIIIDEAQDIEYSCEQCDYKTTNIESRTQHMMTKHQGLSTMMCSNILNLPDPTQSGDDTVNTDVSSRNDLQGTELGLLEEIDFLEHIQSYSGKMYSCGQCNFNSSYQHCLIRHKKSKHEGVVYCCDQCDFITPHSSNLKVHKKAKHLGIKYVCDQCDVSVKYKKI